MKRSNRLWFGCFLLLFGLIMATSGKIDAKAAVGISKTSIKIAQGKSRKIKIKGTSKKVKWSTNKENVITVNDGVITAQKGGKAVVMAKVGSKIYTCKVTVVGLNTTNLTLAVGDNFQLKVKNGKNTTWSSTKTTVAKVTKKGVVKAKKSGTAVIKCKSNGRTVKCKVYVASLNKTSLTFSSEESGQYQLVASNTGSTCKWSSSNTSVASVDSSGLVTTGSKAGRAVITCKTGKAVLTCTVTVASPTNITTAMSSLPSSSNVSKLSVTVNSYPTSRTYTIYNQAGSEWQSSLYPSYMPRHGCAACSLTTVLSAYAGLKTGPVYMVEGIEKNILGSAWQTNYAKYSGTSSKDASMPLSLYGISQILNAYGVENEYVRSFSDSSARVEITNHLMTGNPVIIEVSNKNRSTGKTDTTWSNSKHTMVLLGITDTGYAIVADSVNRSAFSSTQRIKYATVTSLIPYMFSSTNTTSTSVYYTSESACGGYILVNPQ